MSAGEAPAAIPTPGAALARTLGIVATLCGVLIVTAYELTLPAITHHKQVATERAVLTVIPGAVRSREFVLTAQGPRAAEAGAAGPRVHAAYDARGRLKGVAAEAAARGYADTLRLLYGYDLDCQCIVGLRVLQSKETPGIGDKISTEPAFRENFRDLEARLGDDGRALAHAIVTVRHGAKKNPWEIDAVSGATVTSRAVGRALNDSAQQLVPRLVPQAGRLRAEGE